MIKSHGKVTYCHGNSLLDFCGNPDWVWLGDGVAGDLDHGLLVAQLHLVLCHVKQSPSSKLLNPG